MQTEVTESEFWEVIRALNVHPHVMGVYPYSVVLKTESGKEVGKIVDTKEGNKWPPKRTYYLTKEENKS